MPPLPEDLAVLVARIDETVRNMSTRVDEIRETVDSMNEALVNVKSQADKSADKAEVHDETFKTVWQRIDGQRTNLEAIMAFTEQIRGAGKAVIFILSVIQGVLVLLLVWLFTSVAGLREQKAVSDYRLQELERSSHSNPTTKGP